MLFRSYVADHTCEDVWISFPKETITNIVVTPVECPAPTSCPCATWPPASWPCGGLNETYNLSYNMKVWNPPKTSCGDGEPDEVIHYNTTLTPSEGACLWLSFEYWPMAGLGLTDEGTWHVWFLSPPHSWGAHKGGNTPIGSYPDTECVGHLMFTDIVVS